MQKLAAPFALACALFAQGCTTPSTAASAGGIGLAGTHWAVTAIDGQPASVPDRARLSFEDARLSASVGCNGMGGDYRIEAGRLVTGPLIGTRMFCEGTVWQQEQAVNALLAGAPEIRRVGDHLKLESGGHTLEANLAAK